MRATQTRVWNYGDTSAHTVRVRRNLRLPRNQRFFSFISSVRCARQRDSSGVQFAILKIRHSHLRSRDATTKRGENSLCFSTWRHHFLIVPRIKHQARQPLGHASPLRCRAMPTPAFASYSPGDAEARGIFSRFCYGTRKRTISAAKTSETNTPAADALIANVTAYGDARTVNQ